MKKKTSCSFLRQIISLLTYRQRIAFVGLLVFFLANGLLNVFSYAIIAPLIGLASGVNKSIEDRITQTFFPFFGTSHILLNFSLFVLAFQLFRIFFKMISSLFSALFARRIIRRLFKRVLESNMGLSYVEYQKKDFHKVSRDLTFVNRYGTTLTLILEIFANAVILIGYTVLLFYLSWQITGLIFLYFVGVFVLFEVVLKQAIRDFGKQANQFETKQSRAINLLFRNFKFIKTRGESVQILQDQYVDSGVSSFFKRAILSILHILNSSLVEFSGIVVLIALSIYFSCFSNGIAHELGILSIYAISFYRMVPLLNEILSAYQRILEQNDTVNVLLSSLSQSQEKVSYQGDPIKFKDKIVFENVSYAYEEDSFVLQDISLTINRRDRIGVVGESGAGKTTLGDILIGLLQPKTGSIIVDDMILTTENLGRWRKSVGYIPQNIFLFDGTVAENVAFGSPVGEDRLVSALKQAKIWDFLSKKEGVNTHLTLDGSSLSGGQRQRLGIARTFYIGADLIVLDEATSALDSKTEAQIMEELYEHKEDATLFIIAHRLSTLDRCNKIIHMEQGRIRMIETRGMLK